MQDTNQQDPYQKIATDVATDVYNDLGTQYSVARVPAHTHNGVDSNTLPFVNDIPIAGNGVLSPVQLTGVVKGNASATQYVNKGNTGTPSLGGLVGISIPVIQGSGTTFSTTLTASPAAGATSATLTGAWGGTTEIVTSQFGDGEIRKVQFTNGSTAVTWVGGLTFNPVSTSLIQIANARFHGGSAPVGTQIAFVNPDDGLYQLWVRVELADQINRWIGFTNAALAP